MDKYEARPAGCRPTTDFSRYANRAFSVGIGLAVDSGRKPAAIYRVRGNIADEEQIDALATRLVDWLNDPDNAGLAGDGSWRLVSGRQDLCPQHIPWSSDGSAYIFLTSAGKKAGWLKP